MNFVILSLSSLIISSLLIELVLCAKLPHIKTITRDSEDDFCYYNDANCGPTHWHGICNTGNHKHQSPIDIQVNPSKFQNNYQILDFSQSYDTDFQSFYVENNGHSIQISLDEDDDDDDEADEDGRRNLRFSYGVGDNADLYTFSQLHFHWGPSNAEGSEHTINSTSFAMEIHFVHFSAKYDEFEDALEDTSVSDSLSVIGVFVEVRPDCNNIIFEGIVESLKNVSGKPSRKTKVNKPFNLASFLPETMDFFSYEGSLTTPPCLEAVKWSVVQEPICISNDNLEEFRKVNSLDGHNLVSNHRPTQLLGDREVKFFKVGRIPNQPNRAASPELRISDVILTLLVSNALRIFYNS